MAREQPWQWSEEYLGLNPKNFKKSVAKKEGLPGLCNVVSVVYGKYAIDLSGAPH